MDYKPEHYKGYTFEFRLTNGRVWHRVLKNGKQVVGWFNNRTKKDALIGLKANVDDGDF